MDNESSYSRDNYSNLLSIHHGVSIASNASKERDKIVGYYLKV